MDYDYYWDQTQQTLTVFVEAPRYSAVLDHTGSPFKLETKTKVGFDLTPTTKRELNEVQVKPKSNVPKQVLGRHL